MAFLCCCFWAGGCLGVSAVWFDRGEGCPLGSHAEMLTNLAFLLPPSPPPPSPVAGPLGEPAGEPAGLTGEPSPRAAGFVWGVTVFLFSLHPAFIIHDPRSGLFLGGPFSPCCFVVLFLFFTFSRKCPSLESHFRQLLFSNGCFSDSLQ